MSVYDLRPGHFLKFSSEKEDRELMLSSIIRGRDDGRVHGLLACKEVDEVAGYKLLKPGLSKRRDIGTITPLSKAFEQPGHLGELFGLVKFDQGTATEIERSFKVAALSKDFRVNAFSSNGMSVRRIRGTDKHDSERQKKSNRRNRLVYRGVAYGDVTNADIKIKSKNAKVAYAGLIRDKTGVRFAKPGDGGRPVVSSSKALLGFVVASNEDKTLMLTAEDISRELNIEFLVPNHDIIPLSDDVRIRTRP